MKRQPLLALLFFLLTSLAACGGDDDPLAGLCLLDQGRFRDLEVSAGTSPVFRWCGAPAATLDVERSGTRLWRIDCVSPPAAPLCIDPGVTYGDTVANTTATPAAAPPLQAGTQYQFCLLGVDGFPARQCLAFTP